MSHSHVIELTEHKIQSLLEELRPPEEIRNQLDVGYSFDGKELILFEIRPAWDNPQQILQSPFARTCFVKSKGIWKIYWMRGNGKWDRYNPCPEVTNIEEFFDLVDEDQYACFKG